MIHKTKNANLFFLGLALFWTASLAGCSAGGSATTLPAVLSLTDGLGHTVALADPPQRIVSLGPSNTEILFAIGAQDRIVGCDQHSDFPEEAKTLATIADYPVLNVESIVALEPDLVLASELFPAEQARIVRLLVERIDLSPDGIQVRLRAEGLQTLVEEKYLRSIPVDPMTKSATTWVEVRETPAPDEYTPPENMGIVDVRSGSEAKALDGTIFNTW